MGVGGYKTGVEEVEHGEGQGKTGQNNRRVTFPARAAAHFVHQSGAGPSQERKERVSSWFGSSARCIKLVVQGATDQSQGARPDKGGSCRQPSLKLVVTAGCTWL